MRFEESGREDLVGQFVAPKVLALAGIGIVLASSPVFSQGAMTPGGGAITPQPRVAPATPVPAAPAIVPQAPIPQPATPGPTALPAPTSQQRNVGTVSGTIATPTGTRAVKTDASGVMTLGVLAPGTHRIAINVKDLLAGQKTPGSTGAPSAEPAGILIGLLLPAVQKAREAPKLAQVEHTFPRSFFGSSAEVRIGISIPQDGGSAKVDWGDGSPVTDVGRDGASAVRVRVSADVPTLRVQNY